MFLIVSKERLEALEARVKALEMALAEKPAEKEAKEQKKSFAELQNEWLYGENGGNE